MLSSMMWINISQSTNLNYSEMQFLSLPHRWLLHNQRWMTTKCTGIHWMIEPVFLEGLGLVQQLGSRMWTKLSWIYKNNNINKNKASYIPHSQLNLKLTRHKLH
jgi:hypothetical protein